MCGVAWECPWYGCDGWRWLGGWSTVGEGSECCSGRCYWGFIWHWFLNLNFGCGFLVWGEYLHEVVWVEFVEQEASISLSLIL